MLKEVQGSKFQEGESIIIIIIIITTTTTTN